MSGELDIINKIIEWHHRIRENIKFVGESITDREALSGLQEARGDWVPGKLEISAEKQEKLQQAIGLLGDGLKSHFDYEEKYLPPILGELFMRALILEHREVLREYDEAEAAVTNARLEGLSREELIDRESDMHQLVDDLCQAGEKHAAREEVMLEMLQRALLDKEQSND